MIQKITFSICFLLLTFSLLAQKPKIIAGPVIGYVTQTEAAYWFAVKNEIQSQAYLVDTTAQIVYKPSNVRTTDSKGKTAITVEFDGLQPSTVYQIVFEVKGAGYSYGKHIETLSNSEVTEDFEFIAGFMQFYRASFFKTDFYCRSYTCT